MGANSKSEPPITLKADYAAPSASRTFAYALPNPQSLSTEAKIAYFKALRTSVVQLQGDLNSFLTSKMEEDKALVSKTDHITSKEEEDYNEASV